MLHYMLSLLCSMIALHFVADFPLQGDYLAKGKQGVFDTPEMKISHWCLLAHASIHALFVGIITGSLLLSFLELCTHAIIDHCKIENKISFDSDQLLHIGCKIVWVGIFIEFLS